MGFRFSLLKTDMEKLTGLESDLIRKINENSDKLVQSLTDLCKETNAQSFKTVSNILINYLNSIAEMVLQDSVEEWDNAQNSFVKIARNFSVGDESVNLALQYQSAFSDIIAKEYKHQDPIELAISGEAYVTDSHIERIEEIGSECQAALDEIRTETLAVLPSLYEDNILACALAPIIGLQLDGLDSIDKLMIQAAQEMVRQLSEIDKTISANLEEQSVASAARQLFGTDAQKSNAGITVRGNHASSQSATRQPKQDLEQMNKIEEMLGQDLDTPQKIKELKEENQRFQNALKDVNDAEKEKGTNPERWKKAKETLKKVAHSLKKLMPFIGVALAAAGSVLMASDPIKGAILGKIGKVATTFSSNKDIDAEKLKKIASALTALGISDIPSGENTNKDSSENSGKKDGETEPDSKDILKKQVGKYLGGRLDEFGKEVLNTLSDPEDEKGIADVSFAYDSNPSEVRHPMYEKSDTVGIGNRNAPPAYRAAGSLLSGTLGGMYRPAVRFYDGSPDEARPPRAFSDIKKACQNLPEAGLDNGLGHLATSEDIAALQDELRRLEEYIKSESNEKLKFDNQAILPRLLQSACTAAQDTNCCAFSPNQFKADREYDKPQARQISDIADAIDVNRLNEPDGGSRQIRRLAQNMLRSSNSFPCQDQNDGTVITTPHQLISMPDSGIERFYVKDSDLASTLVQAMDANQSTDNFSVLDALSSLALVAGMALVPFIGGLSIPVVIGSIMLLARFSNIKESDFRAIMALKTTIGRETTNRLIKQYQKDKTVEDGSGFCLSGQ